MGFPVTLSGVRALAAKAFAAALLFPAAAVCAGAVTLVADGKSEAVIVTADKPSPAAQEAAKVLGDHLFQISGAQIEIVTEGRLGPVQVKDGRLSVPAASAVPAQAFILLGQSELTRKLGVTVDGLGPGGIVIKTFPNVLILLGTDDATPADTFGTSYAVTTFLEDALGVRYLWPGELGKVVPQRRTITVSDLDVRFAPLLVQRGIRWAGYNPAREKGALDRLGFAEDDFHTARSAAEKTVSTTPRWMLWQRMGGNLNIRIGDGSILPGDIWQKFLAEHPEWFAMQLDGSRDQGDHAKPDGRPRLCKSNPDLIAAIAQVKIEELRRNPGQGSVSLCTHDGGAPGMCLCPACKALDPQDGRPTTLWSYDHATRKVVTFDYVSITDRMVHFYNGIAEKVAAEFPDALFGGQAYSVYSAPPVREKLHPNIVIRYVGVGYSVDEFRRQGVADWDAWARAAAKLYWRPGFLEWNRRKGIPLLYVHKLAEDFRHIAHNRCLGTDFDSCHHNWAGNGLNYYVLAKLHWNPDLDVDAVIEDYCRSGFGAGWQHVRRYLARVEQLSDRIAARKRERGAFDPRDLGETEEYTPQVLAELRGLLDAADAECGDDAAARRRIAFLREGLDWAAVQAETYRFLEIAKERKLSPEECAAAAALLDRRWLLMRRLFTEAHFAVNVTTVTWGDWVRFRALGWTEPSEAARKAAGIAAVKNSAFGETQDKVREANE